MAKGPFMEYLRQVFITSAANTFTEVQIPTPTSKTENMAMLIHSVEMHPSADVDPTTPADGDGVMMAVTKSTQSAIADISDPDNIAHLQIKTRLAAVFNAITYTGSKHIKFDPPLLYPKAHIYLAITSSGFTAAVAGHYRIGYTLEKVSREDFISALVE